MIQQKNYRGIDCIKEFCKKLKDHAVEIINCEEKEMLPLTDDEQEVCRICKGEFCFDEIEGNNLNYIIKSEIIVIKPENLEELLKVFAT